MASELQTIIPYSEDTYNIRNQSDNGNGTTATTDTTTDDSSATTTEQQSTTTNDNGNGTTTTTTTSSVPTEAQKMDYANGLLEQLARIRDERAKLQAGDETEEARLKKEQRKAARDRVIASIGHGLNALVNLGATTAYAPNAQVPNLAEPWQKRYEEMEKKRESNKEFHQKAMQNLQTQDYTITKALADLGLKDKDFIRKLLETQNRNANRDKSTENATNVANARVANLNSGTELNGHKATLADKQGEAVIENAKSNTKRADAAVTNASNNTKRTNTYVQKGGSGSKEYTETTETTAINPVTGRQYQKITTKTRQNGVIPGF